MVLVLDIYVENIYVVKQIYYKLITKLFCDIIVYMSDPVFDENVKVEVKEKKVRKKREISDERREQLKEQLRKGRETALKNRQKKALVKKIDKEEEEKATNEKIAKKVLGVDEKDTINELKEEIKSLKENGGSNSEIKELNEKLKIVGGVLDGLVKDNISYKKRKEEKALKKKELEVVEEKVVEKPKKVFNTKDYRKLKGFL